MQDVAVRAITFAGADEDVSALLVSPVGVAAPGPGLLFVHWGFGDRTSFEREAASYARVGATSLLIDAPGFGLRKGGGIGSKDAAAVETYCRRFLGDLASAVDLLVAQPEVDASRIGYVGHSLGATIAGAFLAREPRVRAAVLMTPAGRLSKLWLAAPDPDRRLEAFDNVANLSRAAAALLFQFAERDEWITSADADAQVAAANGCTVQRYATDHALDSLAMAARAVWFANNLPLQRAPETPNGDALPRAQVRNYRRIKPLLRIRNWFARKRR